MDPIVCAYNSSRRSLAGLDVLFLARPAGTGPTLQLVGNTHYFDKTRLRPKNLVFLL